MRWASRTARSDGTTCWYIAATPWYNVTMLSTVPIIEADAVYTLRCAGCNAEMATAKAREMLSSVGSKCAACTTPIRTRRYLLDRIARLFRAAPAVRLVLILSGPLVSNKISVYIDRDGSHASRPGKAVCDMLGLPRDMLWVSWHPHMNPGDVVLYCRDTDTTRDV